MGTVAEQPTPPDSQKINAYKNEKNVF